MLPPSAHKFYATQQRVNRVAQLQVQRLWRKMGSDFEGSWRRVGPQIVSVISAAQLATAEASVPYLKSLASQTVDAAAEGQLRPESLAGTASDGRPLDSLAYGAVVKSGQAFNDGATQTQALKAGGSWLSLMSSLQVADAARQAVSIGACVRPEWKGYVRYLSPPSCSRCAILAGRVYKWSSGFDRHLNCDCINVPVQSSSWAESEGFIGNPDDAWRQGHVTDLTKTQQKALEDGADMSQLINAKRGMTTTTTIKGTRFDFTLAGTTKRGVYGSSEFAQAAGYNAVKTGRSQGYIKNQVVRYAKRSRLTPETIYRAAENRADAIRLLRNYGYII